MPFVPLSQTRAAPRGFTPIPPAGPEQEPGSLVHPAAETVLDIARVYPVVEAAGNLASQIVSLPVAGIAGLGAAATKALGLTKAEPADVVNQVGNVLTYQPVTEAGQRFTHTATYPFEKLAEAGQYAGGKTLDATGSPELATVVDTAIQSAPMALGIKSKGGKPKAEGRNGFTPMEENAPPTHQEASQGVSVSSDAVASTTGAEIAHTAPMRVSPEMVAAWELSRDGVTTEGGNPNAILQAGDVLHRAGAIKDVEGFARVADDIRAVQALGLPEEARQVAIKGVVKKHLEEAKNGRTDQTIQGGMGRVEEHEDLLPRPEKQELQELRGAGDHDLPGMAERFPEVPGRRGPEAEPRPVDMAGEIGHQRELPAGEREVGTAHAPDQEAAILPPDQLVRAAGDLEGNSPAYRVAAGDLLETDRQAGHGAGDSSARQASATEGFTPVDTQRADIERATMGEGIGDFQRDPVRPAEIRDAAGQGIIPRASGFTPSHVERANHDTTGMGEGAGREVVGAATASVPARPSSGAGIEGGRPAEAPRVAGKPVAEYADAALERLSKSRLISDDARAKVIGEIARRDEVRSEPVRNLVRSKNSNIDNVVKVSDDVVSEPVSAEFTVSKAEVAAPVATETMPETTVDSRASWAPGANYAGFVDRAETTGKLADKPIRREDVLTPLMKALGARVYEGRVKGKNRLGTFTPKLGAVRIKRKSDLEVAAHEIAHLLDDRVPEIRKSWLQGPQSKVYADELRGVSYDKKKVYEGFAEFVRLHMTQPEKAKAAAPHFSKWFDGFTARHEYGPAIRKAQDDMTAWFSQDALHRAQSKIGKRQELNKALDGTFDQFRQATVDDLHGLYRMERDMTGKTSPVGAYETARLTRGAYAITDGAIRMGHPVRKADGSFAFEGKGLEKILDPVSSRFDEFLMYAVGKSAQELMGQNREHLFTPAEVNAMVALERPGYRTAFAEYQKWNNGIVDFAQDMGIINAQSRALWQRTQYLPFYRASQGGASKRAGGVEGNWQGVRKLTGGTDNLRDILGNITQNASMLISAALKNEARAKIAELAERPGGGQFMVKIQGDAKPVRIDREQVSKAVMEALGLDKATIKGNPEAAKLAEHAKLIEQQIMASPGMFEFFQHNQAPKGNIMAVLSDGKPTYYEVADPLLMRSIQALDRPAQHWLVNLLGIPKRVGQATITMTPDFMVANIARDTIMGSVMSQGGFIPVVDSLKGMASRIKKDASYQEFIANGGGMASYLLDEKNMRAHLERFYTKKGINARTVLDTPDKLMFAIETIADSFEMSTRLGEYKRLREQGAHPRHAAYLARDISTDFAMKGDSQVLGFFYDTVMFLRPAVVSMDRLYRGLAHDPNKGAIMAKSATLAAMSAALYLHNRDNPKYDELEDWDKDNYWHFFIPRPDGSDVHFRYPKIWEIGALSSVAERTMEHTIDGDALGYGKDSARILGHLFNLNLMPQILAPLAEQAANKNGFTNRPIETQGMENLQPFMRAKPTTSETLKAAGMATRNLPESLQVNPVRAEALIRGYFNTWGMYGLMLADEAFFGDKLPTKRLDEMPVVRRFYEGEPAKHTKFETQFYDMLGEAKRLHNTMKALDKQNRPDIATEIEQRPMTLMDKQLERAAKELHGINGDMIEVRRSDLTPDEKRQRLDALTVEKNNLLKAVVSDVKEQQKGVAK